MDVVDLYPLVPTPHLDEVRAFSPAVLEARIVFDSTWFVLLEVGGARSFILAFMSPDHPSNPPGPEPFGGLGMILTVQVADAHAEDERVVGLGVTPHLRLREEPWGQRRFMLRDPAGLLIDVVEQIEPAAGYWDP